jgi:hypothetical protein
MPPGIRYSVPCMKQELYEKLTYYTYAMVCNLPPVYSLCHTQKASHIHLLSKLGINGVILLFSYIPSWRGHGTLHLVFLLFFLFNICGSENHALY